MKDLIYKQRVVKGQNLARTLVWLGFTYRASDDGYYIFDRTQRFDRAWSDLHALRSNVRG